MKTPSLDELTKLRRHDSQDMLGFVDRLPVMARQAFAKGSAWAPPGTRPGRILVVGMGGSAISGDLARTLLSPTWPVPIDVIRQPGLPAWVDTDSLVVFLSYSGQTAETLAAFGQTLERGIPAMVVTCGGALGEQATKVGVSILGLTPGWQPRAALGELYFTLLGMLQALGAPIAADLALGRLDALRSEYGLESSDNLAKRIAISLLPEREWRLPAIFGVSPSTEAVARRWKCQLNENAKITALYGVFPELTHNEIVNLVETPAGRGPIVVLRDPADPDLVQRQIGHALDLLGGATFDLQADGADVLSRQMALVYLGDFVSVYLAMLRGVDPTPVAPIVALKERMARR